MKIILVAILVALSVSTSSASFAAANRINDNGPTLSAIPGSITFEQVEKSKLDVVIPNHPISTLNIRLTDASGKIIAAKTIFKKETATRVRFNLTELNDGVYYVRIGSGKSTQVKKFEIKTATPAQTYYQAVTFI